MAANVTLLLLIDRVYLLQAGPRDKLSAILGEELSLNMQMKRSGVLASTFRQQQEEEGELT